MIPSSGLIICWAAHGILEDVGLLLLISVWLILEATAHEQPDGVDALGKACGGRPGGSTSSLDARPSQHLCVFSNMEALRLLPLGLLCRFICTFSYVHFYVVGTIDLISGHW